MEFSKHGSVTRMASEITLRSCSSKWVNNQMEVNDRPMKSGGDGANTTKALMADNVTFTVVIYRRVVHFLTSLNAEKHCSILCLFFNEHELCAKTARFYVYFLTSMNYTLKMLDLMFIF